jgi:hypothetical protein
MLVKLEGVSRSSVYGAEEVLQAVLRCENVCEIETLYLDTIISRRNILKGERCFKG